MGSSELAVRSVESARGPDPARRQPPPVPAALPGDQLRLSSEARPHRKPLVPRSRLAASAKTNLIGGAVGLVVTGAVLVLSGLSLPFAFGLAAVLIVASMAFMLGATWLADKWRNAPSRPAAPPAAPKPAAPASQVDHSATDRAIDTMATVQAVTNIATGKGDAMDSVYLVSQAGRPEAGSTMRNVYLAYQVGKAIGNLASAASK